MDTEPAAAASTSRAIAWTAVGIAGAHLTVVLLALVASLENADGWGSVYGVMAFAAALPVLPGLLVGLAVARGPEPTRAGAVTGLVLAALPPLGFLAILAGSGR